MKLKHKVLKDFQLITPEKKIVTLKAGTILEEYKLVTKSDRIDVEKDVIENNPEFFTPLDWRAELLSYMKSNKIPQPAVLSKKISPFIEEMFILNIKEDSSDSSEREYKSKLKEIIQKEVDLENDYKSRYRDLDEKERSLESKLTKSEIELEREYRSKLKSASEKESDFELQLITLNRKEEDLKRSLEDITRRENYIKESHSEIKEKDIEVFSKLRDIKEKEDRLRILESDLSQRELNIDKIILESENNLDEKQKEIQQKLEFKIKELEIKEEEYNKKSEFISDKEIEIDNKLNKLSSTLEEQYQLKLDSVNKRELDLKKEIEVNRGSIEQKYRELLEEKLEEIEEAYRDKIQELSDISDTGIGNEAEIVNNIKQMLIDIHGSLPYYQNKMDVLKKRLEEILEQFVRI